MKTIKLILLLLLPGVLLAQVRFTASVDARQVVLGGTFQVEFMLENAEGTDLTPPSFKKFEVVGGPSESRRVSIVNGVRSQSYGVAYVLQPKQIGKASIGSASIKVNGQTYRTQPVQVDVVKGKNSDASTKQELDKELSKGVFIKAIIDKEASKIGEQVVLDYKLFITRDLEGISILSESDYPGFFTHEMRRYDGRRIQEVIDGVQYTTKIVKRVALFPQQAGVFEIEPLTLNASVAIGQTKRSFFSVPKVTTFQIKTEPVKLTVEPLPDPAPPTFTGAVGKYYLNASVNRNKMTTDDAITLRLYVTGDGDIKQVQAPVLELSDNYDVYDPKLIEESNYEDGGRLRGKKEFVYQILAKKPGLLDFAASFTYFDADSLDYITLNSNRFTIDVKKGELDREQNIPKGGHGVKQEDIHYIKTDVDLLTSGKPFVGSGLFWTLTILPFLLLGAMIVVRQIETSKGSVSASELRRRKAVKVAQQRLAQSKNLMDAGDSKSFYDEVSRASFGYVCDKFNIPLSELSKQNVQSKLQALNVSDTSIDRFIQIVKTCEMALFAGKDNATAMQETYTQAIDVIAEIEADLIA